MFANFGFFVQVRLMPDLRVTDNLAQLHVQMRSCRLVVCDASLHSKSVSDLRHQPASVCSTFLGNLSNLTKSN